MFRNNIIRGFSYSNNNHNHNNYHNNSTNKYYQKCTNCGKSGHAFKDCADPVLSYGMMLFKFNNPDWTISKHLCSPDNDASIYGENLQILMIRRKDSLRFVEFVRGKYLVNDIEYLKQIFTNITPEERELILSKTFPELWHHVWGTSNPRNYRNDFELSQIKFNELRAIPGKTEGKTLLQEMMDEAPVIWTEPEWGFPKGRRNIDEADIDCAIRETTEETGLTPSQYQIFETIEPLSETFCGDNKVHYCHKYYLGLANSNAIVKLNSLNPHMSREIGDLRWVGLNEALTLIRPENSEKRQVLEKAISIFQNFCPFIHGRLFFTK